MTVMLKGMEFVTVGFKMRNAGRRMHWQAMAKVGGRAALRFSSKDEATFLGGSASAQQVCSGLGLVEAH